MPRTGITTRAPDEPPDADFAIYIDFEKGAARPQRIFKAIDGLISAFERLDRALAEAISPTIEPVLMLEDIEAGSLKVWLRDRLKNTDDDALHKLDWKQAVGKYLVAAKYAFVAWVNDSERRGEKGSLADLRREFVQLAAQTDVKKMADYSPPSATELISSAGEMTKALSYLDTKDKAKLITAQGEQNFDLTIDWGPDTIADLAIRETLTMPPAPMILAVRRPDYLGETQWEFRHGKKLLRAKIEDKVWLAGFLNRKIDVRPGDALKCRVGVELAYGYDNELVSETYRIDEVVEVLENEYSHPDFFRDDGQAR
ncbi:hypothetical protein [Bradyrhizobium centrosematis]|uniref:hypothetical protein n=1 Tax=Bradyrhizobium centrosematis TaxID=1300039 RepID=UPI00388DCF1E